MWWTSDYEPVIHRPPKVSLPAAGHVAGAAYFYPPNTGGNTEVLKVFLKKFLII